MKKQDFAIFTGQFVKLSSLPLRYLGELLPRSQYTEVTSFQIGIKQIQAVN